MAHPIAAAAAAGDGIPGGAAHAEVPAAPVPPTTRAAAQPRSYRELCSDAAYSPAPERTREYLQGYRFTDGGLGPVPVPATLRDQTVTLCDRRPMVFLCLVDGIGSALEVSVIHRLVRYMDMPGEAESGYHDQVLGLLGDILPHQYPTVEVPSTAFHLMGNAVRVPTTDAMEAWIATSQPGKNYM